MLTYRNFIDEMVAVARSCVLANRIRAHGHPVRTNEGSLPLDDMEAAQKALFLALSPPQREVLAQLLVSEREGAVHDVLAYLEWATVTDALDMMAAGEHFAGKTEASMHGDFIARLAGWTWPERPNTRDREHTHAGTERPSR